MVDILLPALALSLALLFALLPFGVEIVRRGIIFADLTVAQFSAVGVSLALALEMEGYLSLLFLITSALCGGLLGFAVSKIKRIEAFIGTLYAFGWSLSLLLLAGSPKGAEEFLKILASDLLFAGWMDVAVISSLAVVSNLSHLLFRKRESLLGNLLFFLLFSLCVSFGVKSAGIMVVFALLLCPALAGINLFPSRERLSAIVIGSLAVIVSLYLSYLLDLPSGLVAVFALSVVGIGSFVKVLSK